MSDYSVHSVSVAGVTFDNAGNVLLIKRRDNGQWQAPGGVLEPGETFEEGVAREVLEETGVVVRVGRLTGVYKNLEKLVVALVYSCSVVRGTPTPSEESAEAAWIPIEDALRRATPAFAVRISDAQARQAASRSHDGHDILERSKGGSA